MFWKNFSTYFNVLYLAQKHLEAYEETLENPKTPANGSVAVQNHRWLDEEYDTREMGEREGNPVPLQATFSHALEGTKQVNNVHLDSAIILGSKILAQRKDTKYVEDALYVVGKAQYYKNDFGGAKRKFLELLTRYPTTKYGASVQVLLSQSMLANHQLDTARTALMTAMAQAQEQGDKHVASEVHRAWAEYIYTKNVDSLTAIADELHQAEEGLSGDELARLATEEGIVYYMNSDWASAERAFSVATDAGSDPWVLGEAHIDHALALRREGAYDKAISELAALVDREKFSPSHPAARYELARTREMAARAVVKNDLKSLAFQERYRMPLLDAYNTLDTAYKNTSALIISRAKYREAEIYREMGEYDSAARFATPLIGTRDFSNEAMNRFVSERMRSLAQFSKWRTELERIDSIEHAVQPKQNYRNDDAEIRLKAMQEVLGPRWSPGTKPEMSGEDSAALVKVIGRLQRDRAAAPPIVDTIKFRDSLHYRASSAHFELGRAYETFNEVPKAREEYRSALGYHFVIPDTGKDALHARELYAWFQLEHREKNEPVADSLLNELLTYYGQTMYAEQARKLYAVQKLDGSPGEAAYNAAYRSLRSTSIENAKPQFFNVVRQYAKEDVAPRSLYAIGLTYEETRHFDSALFYYRRVLHEYPYSSYAAALKERMPDIADANPRSAAQRVESNSPFSTQEDPRQRELEQQQEAERARRQREEELRRQQQNLPQMDDQDQPPVQQQQPPPKTMPGTVPPGAEQPPMPPQPMGPDGQPIPMPQPLGPDGKPIPMPPQPQIGPDGKPLPPTLPPQPKKP